MAKQEGPGGTSGRRAGGRCPCRDVKRVAKRKLSTDVHDALNIHADYHFLEDVGRTADAAARHPTVHSPTEKKLLYRLRNKAQKCNIDLRMLPIGFTKRRENSTTFNFMYILMYTHTVWAKLTIQRKPRKYSSAVKLSFLLGLTREKKFYWHLKLIFPYCHAEYILKGVPDDRTLADILKPYIDPVEPEPVVCQRYNELDASRSLLDNLKGKVIIEYPTLFVVLKTLKTDMVVLGQDASEPAENSDGESSSLSSMEEGEIRDSL